VLVVPDEWTPPRAGTADLAGMGPVVAGIDCEEPSLAAADAACRLAKMLDTSLELVHVTPTLPVLPRWRAHAEAAASCYIEKARRSLDIVVGRLSAEVAVSLHVEAGSVPERLAEWVSPSSERHPILVLGRRTRADRSGAPGAIAYRVLTMAQVPVLVYLPQE
jgi:nucleotide-binding universal stress UspA family protein